MREEGNAGRGVKETKIKSVKNSSKNYF